jgi:hypothetical protein
MNCLFTCLLNSPKANYKASKRRAQKHIHIDKSPNQATCIIQIIMQFQQVQQYNNHNNNNNILSSNDDKIIVLFCGFQLTIEENILFQTCLSQSEKM